MLRACPVCDRRYEGEQLRCPRDGGRLISLEGTLAPGSVVDGRYTVVRLLDRGGMGGIYQARVAGRDRDVALKLLLNAHKASPAAVRRFLQEARILRDLRHPHIVSVIDFGSDPEGQLFIAMEKLEGRRLSDRLLVEGAVPPEEAIELVLQVCEGLAFAHERGVVHRDLKPDNLFLVAGQDGSEFIKIIDFGVARVEGMGEQEGTPTEPGVVVGTPSYLSAEQARGAPVDARSDIYSLGAVLYEMLSGAKVFGEGHHLDVLLKQAYEDPTPIRRAHPHIAVSEALDALVIRMLAKDPTRRPGSARETAELLKGVTETLGERGEGVVTRLPPQKKRALANDDTLDSTGEDRVAAVRGGELRFAFPIVGRARERAALGRYARESAEEGVARCIALEGELGVGKRKLVDWLSGYAGNRWGYRTLRGSYGRHSHQSLQGIRQILLAAVDGVGAGETSESDVAVLRAFVNPGEERGHLMAAPDPGAEDRLFAALTRILSREAERSPLLLVMEDLHNAGIATFRFLEYLLSTAFLRETPIIVAFTFQKEECPEEHPFWQTMRWLARQDGRHFHRVQLGRLADEEQEALFDAIGEMSLGLREYLRYMGAGNPLHTLQLARYLREEEFLEESEGIWDLVEGATGHAGIPPALADLVRSRVRAVVSKDPRGHLEGLIQRAGLLGARFPLALLEELLRLEGDEASLESLDEDLDLLAEEGLASCVGPPGEEELRFDHGLVREMVVQEISERRSARKLHRSVARAMLRFHGDGAAPFRARIAEHFLSAGDRLAAAESYMLAGRLALDVSDAAGAADLLRVGWQVARKEPAAGLPLLLSLCSGLAEAQNRLGELKSARESLEDLLILAAKAGDPAHRGAALVRLAGLDLHDGRIDEAFSRLDAARVDARAASDRGLEGEVMMRRGELYERRALYEEARRAYQEGESLFREQDDVGKVSLAISAQAVVSLWFGESDEAREMAERAIAIGEGVAPPHVQARNWNRLGIMHSQQGRKVESLASFQRSLAIAEKVGYRFGLAHALGNVGAGYAAVGDVEAARRALSRAYALRDDFGDRWGVANSLLNLAFVDLIDEEWRRSLRLGARALDMYTGLGDIRGMAVSLENLGHAARGQGDHERAREHYERAIGLAGELGALWKGVGECHEGLWEIWRARGDEAKARAHLEAAGRVYEELGNQEALDCLARRRDELEPNFASGCGQPTAGAAPWDLQ